MIYDGSKKRLPTSFYISKGKVAEKVMTLITRRDDESAEVTIDNIRAIVLRHQQEYIDEPILQRPWQKLLTG